MSRSFTYQIDEKRLKSKLRSVTIPLNPDAWQWFDIHAGLEKPMPVKRLIPIDIMGPLQRIRIDRKVLMSAAVVAAILLLALTLVSFLDFGKARPKPSLQAVVNTEPAKPVKMMQASMIPVSGDDISLRVADINIAAASPVPVAATKTEAAPLPKITRKPIAKAIQLDAEPAIAESLEPVSSVQLPVAEEPDLK